MRTEHPIFNVVRSILDAGNFQYDCPNEEPGELVARLNIAASNGHWSGVIRCRENSQVLGLVGLFPATISADRNKETSRLIEQLNEKLQFGCFHRMDDAAVVFRMSAIIPEDIEPEEQIRIHLRILDQTMNDAFPLVMGVVYGDWTAEAALKRASEANGPRGSRDSHHHLN